MHDQQQAVEAGPLEPADELVQVMVEFGPDVGIERRGADALVEADRGQHIGRDAEIGTRHLAPREFCRRPLVHGIGERVHEADRHRLHAFLSEQGKRLFHLVEIERSSFRAVSVEPALDTRAQIARQ